MTHKGEPWVFHGEPHITIKSVLQKKLKFDFQKLGTYEIDFLTSILEKLEILTDSFREFLDYYIKSQNNRGKVAFYNEKQVEYYSASLSVPSNDIFGQLESGWILGRNEVYFYFDDGSHSNFHISYGDMAKLEWKKVNLLFKSNCSLKTSLGLYVGIACDLMASHKLFFKDILSAEKKWKKEIEAIKLAFEKQYQTKLSLSKNNYLNDLDKDSNGEIDLIPNELVKLLNKNQKRVLEIDKNYIHQLVKVSNFIKIKNENIQKIFESIRDTSTQEELKERVNLLKNQIHVYELLVFHSINMIGALVSEDLITFYEIYETYDKLGIFNSNWENDVSKKLTKIGKGLSELMYSIDSMERNIVGGLNKLSYVTQDGFSDLNQNVTRELQSIGSSIKFNNLLTGISTYQLYKINKQTKGLIE